MTTFAITGASGTLGRLVADAVLARVDAADVVLLSRDPSKLDARGAQTRAADFSAPAPLPAAFAGVDRLLLISTDAIGARVEGHLAAIDAAVAAGVTWIGYTSVTDPSDTNPAVVAAEHRATEDHLRASGVAWTFLRNSIYAEMLVPSAQGALATGSFVTNLGPRGATSYVGRADCAAVAAAVLVEGGHDGEALDVTGTEALDAEAQAALFTAVGGTPVEVVHVDDVAFAAGLVEHAGMPADVAAAYTTFGTAARHGYSDSVSTVVRDVTGREPIPARDVLRDALPATA